MKSIIAIAAVTLIPFVTSAQTKPAFDDELNSELDQLYTQSADANSTGSVKAPKQVQTVVVQQMPRTVIAQEAQPQAMVVQKQPTTYVEATPLTESRAEMMRKARQESELQTEQKIVEKLEASRLEDEKRRSEVLFGDKFSQLQNPQAAQAQPIAQAPVVPVAMPEQIVAAPVVKEDKMDKEAVRGEITAALEELKAKEEAKKNERKSFFSVLAGMGEYEAKNTRGNYSLGFSFGQKVNDRMIVEGLFSYSNFEVEDVGASVWSGYGYAYYPRITNMDQYQAGAVMKYQILGGMFRPVVGGAAVYTYRSYNDIQFGYANNDATSHAIDLGLVAGFDFELSEGFALGLDYKYMFNLINRTQTNGYQKSFSQVINDGKTPVEKINYSTISLTGRMTF